MRSFDSYISRRKISDVPAWLSAAGIKDLASLARLCETEGIEFDETRLSKYFLKEEPPVIAPKKAAPKSRRKVTTTKEDDNSSWHVPAAERPLGKPKRARKTPAKTRATKKTTTKKE